MELKQRNIMRVREKSRGNRGAQRNTVLFHSPEDCR